MTVLKTTISICEFCYLHIPANIVEENNKILLKKTCVCNNQTLTYLVEDDVDFYKSLKKTHSEPYDFDVVLFEVTDKCNLKCPHCYHLPFNTAKDKSIEDIFKEIDGFPNSKYYMLAGAEPSVRKDIIEVISKITGKYDNILLMLTNGVRFHDYKFVEQLKNAGLSGICVGLNHESYQGKSIHDKQLKGLFNAHSLGIKNSYIGYTLEKWDHIPHVLKEAQNISYITEMIRVRMGSDIGRSPGEGHKTLSQLTKKVIEYAKQLNLEFKILEADNNIYHMMVQVGNAPIRLIQWPDIKNIVMDELNSGPWCYFYEGPITNFVHQVITRDVYKNKGIIAPDFCPEKYHYKKVRVA